MLRGPIEYFPPIEVEVVAHRKIIPLDANEGIYVRNTSSGEVRSVIGQAYMLDQDEELWEKKIPANVIKLLLQARNSFDDKTAASMDQFDATRVVTFQVPHNGVCQIYDYKGRKARVEFGPTLVMLGPDEQFTRLSLSAGRPKMPNKVETLYLLLGPGYFTDKIIVETADHARLSVQISCRWNFEVDKHCTQEEAAKLFVVSDFIGDACKTISSLIRGALTSVTFDDFHRVSLIPHSVRN